jgi:hypothetical protein
MRTCCLIFSRTQIDYNGKFDSSSWEGAGSCSCYKLDNILSIVYISTYLVNNTSNIIADLDIKNVNFNY